MTTSTASGFDIAGSIRDSVDLVRRVPFALCLLLLAAHCRREAPPAPAPAADTPAPRIIVRTRKCMGTECELKAFAGDELLVERAFGRGFDELDRIEALTTSWRNSSEVSRINEAAGKAAVRVSADTLAIIEKSLWVSSLTDGAFDITVGVYRGLWKFDEDNDGSLPDRAEVTRRRALVDWHDVIVDHAASTVRLRRPGQSINLGGIAKGYAVDAAVKVIRAAGVHDFIVHAGGDLFASGRKGDREWRVGIQDPRGPHGRIIFEIALTDQAFNTSGDYERFIMRDGVRYHHILDARTGFPAQGTRSVTLLAGDSFTADALDTALFAIGPERALKIVEGEPGLEAVIVDADNRVHISPGLHGRLIKRGDPSPGP
jgi:thiamine biosynthesis lipoprotein